LLRLASLLTLVFIYISALNMNVLRAPSRCTCTTQHNISQLGHSHVVQLELKRVCVPPARANPYGLQDVLVGASVIIAASAAIVSGTKKDPVPCALCLGTGGVQCFICNGDGENPNQPKSSNSRETDPMEKPVKRDFIGRQPRNPRECRGCKGVGLNLCSKCGGSGYT
jgi:hypothetical protein